MLFVGVDPGAHGSLGLLDVTAAGVIASARVFDTPSIQVKVGKTMRTRIDEAGVRDLLMMEVMRFGGCYAVLEGVAPQPKFGGSTNFWLGQSLGVWSACLTCCSIPYKLVYSQTWKKAFSIVKDDKNKSQAMQIARRMFPQLSAELKRVKDDGRAEAILLADYARRTFTGEHKPLEQPQDLFSEVTG